MSVLAPLAVVILALAGCASQDFTPRERLDPKSAVNVTIMSEPWIFAREVPMLAANARDYLSVGVVESNRAGSRTYWFGVFAWSTIDHSAQLGLAPSAQPPKVRLHWPDANLELSPASGSAGPGLSKPVFVDPKEVIMGAWYPLSPAQLAQLGAAVPTAVTLVDESAHSTTFGPWEARPEALKAFLEATGN